MSSDREQHRHGHGGGSVVFDNGIRQSGTLHQGLRGNHKSYDPFQMRRNDRDRRPPRQVVTARLLGDPPPERNGQAQYEAAQRAAAVAHPMSVRR